LWFLLLIMTVVALVGCQMSAQREAADTNGGIPVKDIEHSPLPSNPQLAESITLGAQIVRNTK
jgi:hypothetical protein